MDKRKSAVCRKRIAVVLAIAFCVSLCGCKASDGKTGVTVIASKPTATATQQKIPTTTVKSTSTGTHAGDVSTTTASMSAKAPTTTKAPDTTKAASPKATEKATTARVKQAETTKAVQTTKATTKAPAPDSVSTSSNGYEIKTVGGITYVDGVMIANKTYSLPASYCPGCLTSECDRAYDELKAAAAKEGYSLYISSGFRDYYSQQSLYNGYVAADGKAAADRYSARPGYSEHQTGLAIDLNGVLDSFGDTATGKWVAAHCHEYGFILRYPKGKEAQTGYMYEPWHIRYVGKDTAKKIFESGLCLEEYYGITSAYTD